MKGQKGEPVPQRYEIKIISKGGKELWVDINSSNITFEGEPAVK